MIAEAQRGLEEDAARKSANGWIVCDTDSFATMLWEERYVGNASTAVTEIARQLARRRVYVLTGDEIPWVDDGLRDGEHIRSVMQERFRQELQKQDLLWIEVHGYLGLRLARAVSFIEEAFRAMNLTEP